GNKTLNPRTDRIYQYLNPVGADRIVYLATSTAQIGDRFVVKNIGHYISNPKLQINIGSLIIDYIYPGAAREYIFDGSSWTSGLATQIVGEFNLSVGYDAQAYNYGTAIGYQTRAGDYGLAVGYRAEGQNLGVAIGYDAKGYNSGVAIGYNSQAYNRGVAVGYDTRGYNDGVSLGYQSGFRLSSSTVNQNVLIGAFSGFQLTTGIGNILIGYQTGFNTTTSPHSGSYNILIGYQAGTPANTTSNFLNIGNLIFATGVNTATGTNISNGRVGIRTLSPTSLLHLNGQTGYDQLRLQTPYTPSSSADPNGNVGDIAWDDNYIYVKTNGGWRRFLLETF
ncbi:MAG: hypothetical protein NZ822_02000, partial [Patescibacteria group bacterium]|nr:hypothetical protein [Patescibacteria group bacterium]